MSAAVPAVPHARTPGWAIAVPLAACAVLGVALLLPGSALLLPLVAAGLIGAVLVSVHHAEVVAHKVGEPFGTLVLALAVTVIEVGLVGSIMLSGADGAATLARDTVFATVMIVCNGVVGICLLVGSIRHALPAFRVEGASQALSVLIPMVTLTLVLPSFTTTTPGPMYSASQMVFAGATCLLLYGVFVFVQTVRHRDYFLPVSTATTDAEVHASPPSGRTTAASVVLLVVALVAVVGLAKVLAPRIEAAVDAISAPPAVVGVAIALLVLLPETGAAVRAAGRNRMQTSLNLALGSALATIGLTVPTVVGLSFITGVPLELGLPPKEMVMLALTLLLTVVTLAGGRSTVLHGTVHLVIFGAFLFLAVVP
ncbi:MAG: hypothetical protein U0574_09655 [Phycisphaerales bacterium]